MCFCPLSILWKYKNKNISVKLESSALKNVKGGELFLCCMFHLWSLVPLDVRWKYSHNHKSSVSVFRPWFDQTKSDYLLLIWQVFFHPFAITHIGDFCGTEDTLWYLLLSLSSIYFYPLICTKSANKLEIRNTFFLGLV